LTPEAIRDPAVGVVLGFASQCEILGGGAMAGWWADGAAWAAWAAATGQSGDGGGGSSIGGYILLFCCVWFLVRIVKWRRRRIVEREARYQAEIEMRKREILREQDGRDG
jgi:hypothetical protein